MVIMARIEVKLEDFPEGTEFHIKEFDVPLARTPNEGWMNYFGGKPRAYDLQGLKPGNVWPADSFTHWLQVVKLSQYYSHSITAKMQ